MEKNIHLEESISLTSLIEERHEYMIAGRKEVDQKEISYAGRLIGSDTPTKEIQIDRRTKISDIVIDA